MQHLPKIELHVHLEGTIPPYKALQLAQKNNISLPENIIKDGCYQWSGFLEMITRCYDGVAACIRTKEDYEDIAYEYLKQSANEGVIYTELIISPDHAGFIGLPYPDMVTAIAKAIDRAESEFGIICRMQAVIVRHLGAEHAIQIANKIIANRHPYIVGVNLAGDEVNYPARQFVDIFEKLDAAGFPASIHAGEAQGPESVTESLNILKAKRIGHGVRSIEDKALIERLIQDNILLEICPSSNVEIGVYSGYDTHPLRELFDAGVKICLNSDDPPFFFTTIGREYKIAAEKFGFTTVELLQISRNGVDAAFINSEQIKKSLYKKIDDYADANKKQQQKKTAKKAPNYKP